MSLPTTREFQLIVQYYYAEYGRHDLPWRQPEADGSFDPYKILVAELMLQQTQVNRVIPKFLEFLTYFPNLTSVTSAPLGTILKIWSGLGYNRRAKYLQQAAYQICKSSSFPESITELCCLPGIGSNTAGAIVTYAYNRPVVFIETNIRTVFLYHYFPDQPKVSDATIRTRVDKTLDRTNPRIWYWALMDYGSFLKQAGVRTDRSSAYRKQGRFQGSKRQLRGQIIRSLTQGPMSLAQLRRSIVDRRLIGTLRELEIEELIHRAHGRFCL